MQALQTQSCPPKWLLWLTIFMTFSSTVISVFFTLGSVTLLTSTRDSRFYINPIQGIAPSALSVIPFSLLPLLLRFPVHRFTNPLTQALLNPSEATFKQKAGLFFIPLFLQAFGLMTFTPLISDDYRRDYPKLLLNIYVGAAESFVLFFLCWAAKKSLLQFAPATSSTAFTRTDVPLEPLPQETQKTQESEQEKNNAERALTITVPQESSDDDLNATIGHSVFFPMTPRNYRALPSVPNESNEVQQIRAHVREHSA